jgi:hypothetical protein
MIVTVVSTIQAVKVKTLLRRVHITIRIVGPNAIRIGKYREECEGQVGGVNDGLELLPNDAPYIAWWAGDLWAIAVSAPAQFIILETSNPWGL